MSEPEKICTDIAPLLDAFFDGELNEGERQSVEKHVAICDPCQLKLGEIGRLVKTLRDMPVLQPSRDLAESFPELLAKRQANNVVTLRPTTWISLAVAAAAVLLFIAFRALNMPASAPVVANGTQTGKPGAIEVPPSNRTTAQKQDIASNGTYQDQQMIHSTGNAKNGEKTGGPAARLHEAIRPTVVANSPRTATGDGSTAGHNQNMIAENGANESANQSINASREESEDVSKPGSVVASLDEVGHSAVAGAIGLSTDEDGLYAIEM